MKFLETSAKTAQNVAESFVTMTKEIISISADKEKAMSKNGKFFFIFLEEEKKKNKVLLSQDRSESLNTRNG
jgi:hypothetical protein